MSAFEFSCDRPRHVEPVKIAPVFGPPCPKCNGRRTCRFRPNGTSKGFYCRTCDKPNHRERCARYRSRNRIACYERTAAWEVRQAIAYSNAVLREKGLPV